MRSGPTGDQLVVRKQRNGCVYTQLAVDRYMGVGLRIRTLGSFQLWRQQQLVPDGDWPSRKSQTLFKLLLTERGHYVPTDRIQEYLWPDAEPGKAQNSLWVAASHMRRVLQPDLPPRAPSNYIETSHEGYKFMTPGDYWLDLDEFEAHSKAGRISDDPQSRIRSFEVARKLYRGDFLEQNPYEEWGLSTREQILEQHLDLLAHLADEYAKQGHYRRAIAIDQEILAKDDLRESAYKGLMVYHYCAGDRGAAMRVFDAYRRQLRADLQAEPSSELLDLYEQIQRGNVKAVDDEPVYPKPLATLEVPYSFGRMPLVGRDREYGQLVQLVSSAEGGNGGVVMIEGEAGIGKSRLLQEIASYAEHEGHKVFLINCYAPEQDMPYQALVQLLDAVLEIVSSDDLRDLSSASLHEVSILAPRLHELVPGLAPAPSPLDELRKTRLHQGIVDLLLALVGDGSVVLAFDDIHWADDATLQFIHHFATRISDRAIVLIASYRTEELAHDEALSAIIHSLTRLPHTLGMVLARLGPEDAYSMLNNLAEGADGSVDLAEWLQSETEGNPFYFVSILQSLLEGGLLRIQPDKGLQVDFEELYSAEADLTLPESVRESIRERLRRVPPTAREALAGASVLGRRFDFQTLGRITGVDEQDLLESIDDLLARQLLTEDAPREQFDFSHDKIREVIYHDLNHRRRAGLHNAAAEALENQFSDQLDEVAARLGYHFQSAGESAKALSYYSMAGDRAFRLFANAEAIPNYSNAIEIAEEASAASRELTHLYLNRGRALELTAKYQDALATYEGLESLADERQDEGMKLAALMAQGTLRVTVNPAFDPPKGYALCEASLELARKMDDRAAQAKILWQLLLLNTYTFRAEAALEAGEQSLTIARDEDLRERLAFVLHDLFIPYLGTNQVERIDAVLAEARLHWEELENIPMLADNFKNHSIAAHARGEYEEAAASSDKAFELSQSIDATEQQAISRLVGGSAYLQLGLVDQAIEVMEQAVDLGQEVGNVFAIGYIGAELGLAYGILGDIDRGLELGDSALNATEKHFPQLKSHAVAALIRLRLIEGDVAAAKAVGESVPDYHKFRRMIGNMGPYWVSLALAQARLGLVQEDYPRAENILSDLFGELEEFYGRQFHAETLHLTGLALLGQGKVEDGRQALGAARAEAEATGSRWALWPILAEIGDLERRDGRLVEAKDLYREARETLKFITSHIGDSKLRASFIATPQVKAVLSD